MIRKVCTRKTDELGRIVLPLEARSALGIAERQSLAVFIDPEQDAILLKPDREVPACRLCGATEQLKEIDRFLLCGGCIAKIKEG